MTQTIAEYPASRIATWHEVQDEAKLAALVDSMTRDGWVGAPIVVITEADADPQAITGSHRVPAAAEAGIAVPAVELADLLAAEGANLEDLIADFEAAGLDREDAIHEVVVRLDEHLPTEVIDHYGLDAH